MIFANFLKMAILIMAIFSKNFENYIFRSSKFFEKIAIIGIEIRKNYIQGEFVKNPKTHPSYDLCDFPQKMTVQAQK